MSDLEELREAINDVVLLRCEDHSALLPVIAAARRWLAVQEGEVLIIQRDQINYEAAAETLGRLLSIAFPGPWPRDGLGRLAAEVVDAALPGEV